MSPMFWRFVIGVGLDARVPFLENHYFAVSKLSALPQATVVNTSTPLPVRNLGGAPVRPFDSLRLILV
jgi:hypothetical protein